MQCLSNKKYSQYVIVMRHGEREDDSKNDIHLIHNLNDPVLTNNGISQAYSIGQQINELISQSSIEKKLIKVFSSPFTRTLMTANFVLDGLADIQNTFKFYIDYGLYEFLNTKNFKSHPEEFLEINMNKNFLETLLREKKNILEFDNEIKQGMPSFPENITEMVNRYKKTVQNIQEMSDDSNIIIIVTHGYGVQVIAEYLNIPEDFFYVDYCCTFVFGSDDNKKFHYIKQLNPYVNI